MKNAVIFYLYLMLLQTSCTVYRPDLSITSCPVDPQPPISSFSRADAVQQALEQLLRAGVPGVAMAVCSPEGWWATSVGVAKIEDQTAMQVCHLQYLQSVSKTYMAVAVLKLSEMGKIDLDAAISRYLPDRISRQITGAERITVRMLLNHTSGIPDYNFAPAYVSTLLQHPDHLFSPEDYLTYIDGKPLEFEPGSRYAYRNANYLLLALLTDAVTGDHARFIREAIFRPLELMHTFYQGDQGYLTYPELINGYWDRYSDGIIENASRLQRNNVAALVGDDGIVTTPTEAVLFLKGLMEGKLIAPATLDDMKSWVTDSKGEPTYGLGLDYTTILGHPAFGHSGGGIGAGCQLYYIPDKNLYYFVGINLGTVTDSPIHQVAAGAVDQLFHALLDE